MAGALCIFIFLNVLLSGSYDRAKTIGWRGKDAKVAQNEEVSTPL